jgi:hypothetical protein
MMVAITTAIFANPKPTSAAGPNNKVHPENTVTIEAKTK